MALFHLDTYSHLHDVFLRNSWLFVDFFFVLGGFVIAANYQQWLLNGFGVGRFLLLRLGRLYPLHNTPDRYEHLVRYVGWYSNRARGERAKESLPPSRRRSAFAGRGAGD